MATASEDRCPLCHGSWDNTTCPVPCGHRFCFSCVEQGGQTKPHCLVCRRRVTMIRHLLQGHQIEEDAVSSTAASSGSTQDQGLPAKASRVKEPCNRDAEFVGSLHAVTWGSLFRDHPHLPELLRPWLHQELGRIFEDEPPLALMLEEMLLSALPVYGLHEDDLVEVLQASMGVCTRVFVQGFINFTAEQLSRPAQQLLLQDECRAARRLEESPGTAPISTAIFGWRRERSPGASTSWAAYQERQEGNLVIRSSSAGFQEGQEICLVSSSSWATIGGGRAHCCKASSNSVAFQGQQERSPGASTSPAASQGGTPAPSTSTAAAEAEALPGTSAAASAASQGRGCSRRGPRRPLKRKAGSSQDSAAPTKKPPRRRC